MAGNGELISSLRAGGSSARDAAREIARQNEAGQLRLTPNEAAEVRNLSETPELKDHFSPEVKASLETLGASNPNAPAQPTAVKSLVPSLQQVADARQLPQQFEKDLAVVRQQLTEHPGLSPSEQSGRLFEFFTNYAERLATVVSNAQQSPGKQQDSQQQSGQGQQGTFRLHVPPEMMGQTASLTHSEVLYSLQDKLGSSGAPMTEAQRVRVAAHFEFVLSNAGFDQIRDTRTGQSGLDVAKELLAMRSAREVRDAAAGRQFEVQVRTAAVAQPLGGVDPNALAMEGMRADGTANPLAQASHFPKLKADEQDKQRDDQGRRWRGNSGKVLGSRLLWNVLHRFRGEDEESPNQREAMNDLLVAAGLALLGVSVIAVVWMLL